MRLDRREFILASTATFLPGCVTGARRQGRRIALLGQSLVKHDLCAQDWPDALMLRQRLQGHDAVFSDLEVAIRGPRAGTPTREALTLHTAEPGILDCLSGLGINLFATSNNHAFDLNTGGIVDAIDALEARKLAFAGTGLDLERASAPAFIGSAAGRIGLVAAATGRIRQGGMAAQDRPGVAEIRRDEAGIVNEEDVERTLESIRRSAGSGALTIAYLHNHHWEAPNWRTSDWQRRFARQCIDSGAALFVAHGTPLLQGLEVYRSRPLFHGLGSFIFQTIKEEGAYDSLAWQSVIADCRFEGDRFVSAELVPVQLNAVGVGGPEDLATRGRPRIADPEEARIILERLAFLSEQMDYRFVHDGRTGHLLTD